MATSRKEIFFEPTTRQVYDLVLEVSDKVDRLDSHFQQVSTAFPTNDLNKPDYDGHRQSHNKINRAEENVEGYKQDITKKALWVVVVYIAGLVSTFGINLFNKLGA